MRYLARILLAILLAVGAFFFYRAPLAPRSHVPQQSAIEQYAATVPLRDKIAGLLILHTPGTDPAVLRAYIEHYHPAGLILMSDNIPASAAALRAETAVLQASTTYPYFIATDEEGCTVRRLSSDTFACPEELGSAPVASTTAAFAARSALLKSVGINLNFGIVADVTGNPESFIYSRVFGSNPSLVAQRVQAAVAGTHGLTLSTIKHFPGHGETLHDSHLEIPIIDLSYADWTARDEAPFLSGVSAGADLVMFGHLAYTAVDPKPASLSAPWHQILTGMGFHGLSITDDMLMLQQSKNPAYSDLIGNGIAALQAGNDLLLYVNNHDDPSTDIDVDALIDGIDAAVADGRLAEAQIDAAYVHVLTVRATLR